MSTALTMDATNRHRSFIKENEVLIKADNTWLHFAKPHHVIIAERLEDVLPALHEIEKLIKINNWYAAGFVSFEAASAFDSAFVTPASAKLPKYYSSFRSHRPHAFSESRNLLPFLWFGLYSSPEAISRIGDPNYDVVPTLNWQPTIDRWTYNTAIEQIRNYIAEGQTYQVNYTMRLQTDFTMGSEWDFFLHLVQNQNKNAAYIDIGRYVICSSSPELFFQLDGEMIKCQPMKGTVKRGRTTLEDQAQSEWLKNSEKNRAENVMIVDMIRNDLGRIAKIGSVEVPHLFDTERYATLWQMTSTVAAKTSASLTEIFTALFPCASITGAPKVGTMKIIAALETTSRRMYTGSIGYFAPNRKAIFNVAIRTALIDRESKQAEYGVGGGIVWDSTSADEYEEALLKAGVLTERHIKFSLLETMLWTPEEGFFLREKHIARIMDSAFYFDFPITKLELEEYLNHIASDFASPQRVRLLLDSTGTLTSDISTFQSIKDSLPIKVCLATQAIDIDNVFLFHKTTHRQVYESARNDSLGCADVLLHNKHGEITEFTIGNFVYELDGHLYTPPVSCGLLAGTFRAHLVETGEVAEQTIRIEELKNCTKFFLINSVRKWQEVSLIS